MRIKRVDINMLPSSHPHSFGNYFVAIFGNLHKQIVSCELAAIGLVIIPAVCNTRLIWKFISQSVPFIPTKQITLFFFVSSFKSTQTIKSLLSKFPPELKSACKSQGRWCNPLLLLLPTSVNSYNSQPHTVPSCSLHVARCHWCVNGCEGGSERHFVKVPFKCSCTLRNFTAKLQYSHFPAPNNSCLLFGFFEY